MTEFANIDQEIDYLLSPAEDAGKPKAMGGAYEAADRVQRDLALWTPPIQSADADILPDKEIADARALDILRNDSYVSAGQQLHRDNIVGTQFLLNAQPILRVLDDPRFDETWAEEFQEEVEAKFTAWAESELNWVDASRRNNFTSLIRLAIGIHVASGEVLATVEWLRDMPRPFQTAIQMIELNRLSDPGDRDFDRARVRGGIEFNSYGAPIAYFIRRAQRDAFGFEPQQFQWARILAVKPRLNRRQVIHLMEQGRPSQTRGMSQMVAALKEMKITKKFRDITLQNAVVNASFAAAIESELPPQQAFEALGSGNVGDAVTSYGSQYLGAVAQYTNSAKNMHIDGVRIPHLFPGTKLHLTPMGKPGGVGQDFESSLLRYIASNLGVSYEQLAKDYRETNYSSARAGMLETWKYMMGRKRMIADRFASAVYRLWLEEALGNSRITSMPRNAPNWYEGLNADAYANATWIGAGRGQIDELKETQAARLRIDSRLSTLEQEFGRQGMDWRQALQQIKRERQFAERLGLPDLTPSPEVNAISGDVREASDGSPENAADAREQRSGD